MFRFLKRFFKEEEPEIKILTLDEVKSFFYENSKEKNNGLTNEIKGIKEKIDFEINKTREHIEVLKKAELRNQNIPVRAIHFMQGNRESYIKIVNNLINSVEIGEDYNSIITFTDNFSTKLEHFTKATTKAYQVLQEFFANESRDIALNIKVIDSLVKQLKEIIKKGKLERIKELENEITSIDHKKEKKLTLNRELKEKGSQKDTNVRLKAEFLDSQKKLKESEEYNEFLGLNELKKKSLSGLNDLNSKLSHSFSVINAALKKYERITVKDTSLLDKYIQDPVKSLMDDGELKILEYLKGTKENVSNNSIELKDKKKDKILGELGKLDKESFVDFRGRHNTISSKIKELEDQIKENNSDGKLGELDKKVKETNEVIERLDNYITSLKTEIEKIDFEKIKRKIEEEMKEVFGVSVNIT